MTELGKRVAVAAVGIPVVVGLVYLGGWFFSVPLAAFAAWGAHELARMAAERDVRALEWVAAPATALMVLAATWQPSFTAFAPLALALIAAATLAAFLGALWLRGPAASPLGAAAVTVLGVLYVGLALAFAPLLHALPLQAGWELSSVGTAGAGLAAVALPLAVTWVGDAAA